jgi:hypothetical protein
MARARCQSADQHRQDDAEAAGQPAHEHATQHGGQHGRRARRRAPGAGHAELGLRRRQRYHDEPQAARRPPHSSRHAAQADVDGHGRGRDPGPRETTRKRQVCCSYSPRTRQGRICTRGRGPTPREPACARSSAGTRTAWATRSSSAPSATRARPYSGAVGGAGHLVLGVEEPPAGTCSGDGDHEAVQADASTGSAEPARPPDRCTALLYISI